MRKFWVIALLLVASIICGCSVTFGGKLLAPEAFGLIELTPNLFVEASTDEVARANLREAMIKAEAAIRAAYGNVEARPTVHACITEQCYEKFGGKGSIAKVYGSRILLSPRGLNWHFIAHEWSHAEMSKRLTILAWKRMPQWFDDGVAVAISEAPEHSEEHWQFLVSNNIPRPTREELHTFNSLRQWLDAVGKYGESKNAERKANGKSEIRPVYSAAGHEVRPWLAKQGGAGLVSFIARMNNGEDFMSIYQSANPTVEWDAPPKSVAPRPSP